MEALGAIVLTFDEWTPESGMVTAAQKIQRKSIEKKYEADIKVRLSPEQALYPFGRVNGADAHDLSFH